MEYEATLNTLTSTTATFSVPIATRLKDASIHSSLVAVFTGDASTFRALEWTAGKTYRLKIEGSTA
jgi:hypothetical protein